MHDSDLVETLALLTRIERDRFLVYLSTSPRGASHQISQDAAVFARQIFDCLDKHNSNISKKNIWAKISPSNEYSEDVFDEWISIAVLVVRDALKKDLKKRIPAVKKNINGLIASLNIEERGILQKGLKEKKFSAMDFTQELVSLHCKYWNQYEEALSEKAVYFKLFGKAPEIAGKLPKYRTDVLKLARRFIALQTAEASMSELQEWVCLQKFFQARNSPSQYQKIRNLILRRKEEHHQWSSLDYYHVFTSEAADSNFKGIHNPNTDQNLWETIQSLDEYYFVERLWLSCQLLDQNQTTPLALPPFEEWWHFDISSPHLKWFFDKPIGKLFTLAIQFLLAEESDDEQKLRDFIQYLIKNEAVLSTELVSSFEVFAINYGVRRINRGNFAYSDLVLSILQRRVENGRNYTEGMILSNEFLSITMLGLRLGKFDWVLDFLEKHKKKIEGEMSSIEYYKFCLALHHYYTNDLLAALHILMNADYLDLQFKMTSRILEVKVLCELEWGKQTKLRIDEQLDARIEAGILFFFRLKDVPTQKKKMGKRFMDFMKKIIRAKDNRRWKILEKIKQEVIQIDYIAERQWLIKTIDLYLASPKK